MRLELLDEPLLFFGDNKSSIHAQVGLLAYGPHGGSGTSKVTEIRAGIVGTKSSIDECKAFLSKLRGRILGEKRVSGDYDEIDFPGVGPKTPLGFDIVLDPGAILEIGPEVTKQLQDLGKWREAAMHLMEEYERQLHLLSEVHPPPQVTFLPIDATHLALCKNPTLKQEKIRLEARRFDNPNAANVPFLDFHNRIKAVSSSKNLRTQIIRPTTFAGGKGTQDPSIVAWNFCVAAYYKATGLPWKLADLDDSACHIGLGFYQDFRNVDGTMSASVAQVYMRTGESQVIRGKSFDWNDERDGRDVFLNRTHMTDLVTKSIKLFEDQRKKKPGRITIHKPGPFNVEELEAIESACPNGTSIDAVHVRNQTTFRAYHRGHDYPVVRGTTFLGKEEGFLFATGFTPAMNTYKGRGVPVPIQFRVQKMGTSMLTVATDLMGLTKLDWNTTAFNTRKPVTIEVSHKVGEVMAEMHDIQGEIPSNYAYYM